MTERRKEKRYAVPEMYAKYMSLMIKKDPDEFKLVDLLDFSLEGIKIRNPSILPVDSCIECSIAIPKSLTMEIPFKARIKYCFQEEHDENYLVGAEIISSGKNLWLQIFSKVHDFIKERMGEIY